MSNELDLESLRCGPELIKRGFARMQKGGVVMDVVNPEQAVIAEDAGAVAVMALERVPSDIRADGGVARMSEPNMIEEIIKSVSIPVMAKCRIGHTAEARILESLGVDMIDESEVLTPADPYYHVIKKDFDVPFVCGATNLGEALRRVWEGAAMIRTKGEAGTGNVVAAMRHARLISAEIEAVRVSKDYRSIAEKVIEKYYDLDKETEKNLGVSSKATPFEKEYEEIVEEMSVLIEEVAELGRLPVVTFTAGGIATPADAALMMQFGMDGIFVGSGIFKSKTPEKMAKAIVEATAHYDEAKIVSKVSNKLGDAMAGLEESSLETKMAGRGH